MNPQTLIQFLNAKSKEVLLVKIEPDNNLVHRTLGEWDISNDNAKKIKYIVGIELNSNEILSIYDVSQLYSHYPENTSNSTQVPYTYVYGKPSAVATIWYPTNLPIGQVNGTKLNVPILKPEKAFYHNLGVTNGSQNTNTNLGHLIGSTLSNAKGFTQKIV